MRADVDRVLISSERIQARVRELAAAVTADHSPLKIGDGGEVTIVPILTGAMIFCCDLIRHIPIAMRIGLLTVSSYPGKSLTSQGVTVLQQQLGQVVGRHVVVVDDVLDSGSTLARVIPLIRDLGATSVRTAVLLRKDRPEARQVHVDYVGFDIPDEFIVGYGLDYNDLYRNLPEIVTLRPDAIRGRA